MNFVSSPSAPLPLRPHFGPAVVHDPSQVKMALIFGAAAGDVLALFKQFDAGQLSTRGTVAGLLRALGGPFSHVNERDVGELQRGVGPFSRHRGLPRPAGQRQSAPPPRAHSQQVPAGKSSADVVKADLETLGVGKDATYDECRKAYKALALQHHPDKGGDVEKFKQVEAAHGRLKDWFEAHPVVARAAAAPAAPAPGADDLD